MNTCSKCGTIVSSARTTCPRCGTHITGSPVYGAPAFAATIAPGADAPTTVLSGDYSSKTMVRPVIPGATPSAGPSAGGEWVGRPAPGVTSVYPRFGVPVAGMPETPVMTGSSGTSGRTGIPGVVAFGVSIICVQAWLALMYGAISALVGNAFGNLFSTSESSEFCGEWDSDCSSVQSAADAVVIMGLLIAGFAFILLVAVIAFMRGARVGQVVCCLVQILLIASSVFGAVQSGEPGVAMIGALFPVTALLCIATSPANQMIKAATAATRARRLR